MAEQAAGSQNAWFSGTNTVEHDFSATGRNLLYPNLSFHYQKILLAGSARVKNELSGSPLHRISLIKQGPFIVGQCGKGREIGYPVVQMPTCQPEAIP